LTFYNFCRRFIAENYYFPESEKNVPAYDNEVSVGSCLHKTSESRVTRLDDVTPIGRLFTLGKFKITEVAHIFGVLFPREKLFIFFYKCVGTHFGPFFTNSSGHPIIGRASVPCSFPESAHSVQKIAILIRKK
jgi:hypothetical protein